MTNETHTSHRATSEASGKYSTPAAIVVAGALIALAIYLSGSPQLGGTQRQAGNQPSVAANGSAQEQGNASLDKMSAVTSADHIQGSANAQVKLVEYSDTECPFCQRFHTTLTQLMASEYGKSGKVAWVYRHFPLAQLHSKAPKEAEATECAADQGGNDKFWAFMNRIEEVTPMNNGLDAAQLPVIAKYVGLDVAKFNDCLSSGKFTAKVAAGVSEAMATGGNGTPWSIIVGPTGKKYPLSGAQPLAQVQAAIDQAIANK